MDIAGLRLSREPCKSDLSRPCGSTSNSCNSHSDTASPSDCASRTCGQSEARWFLQELLLKQSKISLQHFKNVNLIFSLTKLVLANAARDHVAVGLAKVAVSLGDVAVHLMLRREARAAVTADNRVTAPRNLGWNVTNHVLHQRGVGLEKRITQETLWWKKKK